VYIYIYIYIYIYVFMYTCKYIYIYIYVCIWTFIYLYVCVYVWIFMCIYEYWHIYVHLYVFSMHVNICMCIYIRSTFNDLGLFLGLHLSRAFRPNGENKEKDKRKHLAINKPILTNNICFDQLWSNLAQKRIILLAIFITRRSDKSKAQGPCWKRCG